MNKRIGSLQDLRMWINTEVVACNGPRHMQPFGRKDTKVFPHLSSALKEATVLGTN